MHRFLAFFALPWLATFSLSAQTPAAGPPQAIPTRVPLHTSPYNASYGLWAAGDGYKASFHDGFVFHPYLGDAYAEGLPLRWNTTEVRVGKMNLLANSRAKAAIRGPWRCDFDHGAVVEVYDLRPEGVEQSFVIKQRPVASGDLVVEGRFETALHIAASEEREFELRFDDAAGNAIASYSRAIAIDATGAEYSVVTELFGQIVRLRVSADDVDRASFPLTIDPLVGRTGVQMLQPVVATDLGCDSVGQGSDTLLAMEVAVAANDHDLYVMIAPSDFSTTSWAMHLLDATDHRDPSVAFTRGANQWIVAFTEPNLRVVAYIHPRGSLVLNAGGSPIHVAWNARQPDVGGSNSAISSDALIVYAGAGSTAKTIFAQTIHLITKTASLPFDVSSIALGSEITRRQPAINQSASSNGWIVAWEESNARPLGTYIRANKAFGDGSIGQNATLSFHPGGAYSEVMRPEVAGAGGRYLASYLAGNVADRDSGAAIHTVRFDWAAFSLLPTILAQREHATTPNSFSGLALAYDHGTRSHWCLVHRRASLFSSSALVQRLGSTGGVVESFVISPGPGATNLAATAATYDALRSRFTFSYATDGQGAPTYIDRLTYAGFLGTYGTSCGGTISAPELPRAGDEFFSIELAVSNTAQSALLLISAHSANLPLDGAGLPGCSLFVNPTVLITLPAPVIVGHASRTIPLPDAPAFLGDVYCQWLVIDSAAGALGVSLSDGLAVHVR